MLVQPFGFLLTPLREGRQTSLDIWHYGDDISTHAPTRGATIDLYLSVSQSPDFYSRPYARGDPVIGAQFEVSAKFLLTPLREGRPERYARVGS